jgi:hypothetical protein
MNPSDQGFLLEEIIHNAVNQFPVLAQNMRETQIKQHFKDNSLNGVDHWIKFGKNNVLIQDKWREVTTQQEVSQFLECTHRLNKKISRDENIYLLWVSKYEPTRNSMASLNDREVEVISCSISIEALARLAILRIADCLQLDPLNALLSIPRNSIPVPVQRASVIMDEEAMEILKIRRELNEKKKQEEEQQKADEIRVRELLKEEPALSWKMRVAPNNEEFQYWPQASYAAGYSSFPVWNSKEGGKSPAEMLNAYTEIQTYRENIRSSVIGHINKNMNNYWTKTDEEILKLDHRGRAFWTWSPLDTQYIVDCLLGNEGTVNNVHPSYWKAFIIREIAQPIIKEEYEKYLLFCEKFIERNKNKAQLPNLEIKVTLLEEENKNIQARNEFLEQNYKLYKEQCKKLEDRNEALEEKLTTIRKMMSN